MSEGVVRSDRPAGSAPRSVGRPVEQARVSSDAFGLVVAPPKISENHLPSEWDPVTSGQGRDGEVLKIEEA